MSRGDYLLGVVLCAAFIGLGVAAALAVVDRQLGWMARAPRLVAAALLTTAFVSTAQLLPLLLGVLTRGTALAAGLLLLALAWRVPRARREPEAGPGDRADASRPRARDASGAPAADSAARLLAAAAVALAAIYVVAFLVHNRSVPIGDYDSTSFILPVPARWIQTGSLWRFDDLVPDWGYGAYPQTGSLLQLVALLPWHNDFALRLVNVPFMAVAVAAATELAVELGALRRVALTLAVVAVLVPAGAAHALDHAQPDMIMAASFVAAALFLVRFVRTRAAIELVLAGIGLGLALGTKWYAGPELIALLGVWVVARALRRERARELAKQTALIAGVAVLVGGCWLLRNLIVGGDPLYPAKVQLLGITIFDAPAATSGSAVDFSLAHYLPHPSILRTYAWPAFRTSFGWAGGLILVGAVVALIRPSAGRVRAVALAALLVFVVYTLMPYSALGPAGHPSFITAGTRYAAPAVLLAAACAACALTNAARPVVVAVQVLALLAIADAFTRYDDQVGSGRFHLSLRDWLAAAALAGAAGALWFAARRFGPRRLVPVTTAVVVAVAAVAVGRKVEQDYNATRYTGVNPAFDWLATKAPPKARVALAGEPDRNSNAAPYIAFGKRLDNRVTFIGHRRKHLLVRFDGGPEFTAALSRGRYQLLLLGWDLTGPPRELAWARAAGWRQLASGGTFTLLAPPATASRSGDVSG